MDSPSVNAGAFFDKTLSFLFQLSAVSFSVLKQRLLRQEKWG
jgi:hypothetical protein